MRNNEASSLWLAHRGGLQDKGVIFDGVRSYLTPDMKRDYRIAMDAVPGLSVGQYSGAIPAMLTTFIDPEIVRVAFAPLDATNILPEQQKGDWTMTTAMFSVVESNGEVSSYSDFNENGRSGINTTYPQRQSYHFQTMKELGEQEIERAGLARLNYVAETDTSAIQNLSRFLNFSYFFGIAGLQNFGLLNDPSLGPALTPGVKVGGNANKWIGAGGQITATANEIFLDIQAVFYQLVLQSAGIISAKDKMVLALSPAVAVALTATNSFNVNVSDLLAKNFPNIRIETAVQYGIQTPANPQGIAAGNFMQLIAETIEGKATAFCAFTEKVRSHKMEVRTSSYKQKMTSGTWGAIIRYPVAIASMLGI